MSKGETTADVLVAPATRVPYLTVTVLAEVMDLLV